MLKGICSLFNTRLAELAVKDGDRVERGQVLPTVGDEKFVLQRRSLDAQIAGLLSL
jgi:multidrug efflux pump subunit AcrA (membrane-fusion protein)